VDLSWEKGVGSITCDVYSEDVLQQIRIIVAPSHWLDSRLAAAERDG
jgi:hypothetical protein